MFGSYIRDTNEDQRWSLLERTLHLIQDQPVILQSLKNNLFNHLGVCNSGTHDDMRPHLWLHVQCLLRRDDWSSFPLLFPNRREEKLSPTRHFQQHKLNSAHFRLLRRPSGLSSVSSDLLSELRVDFRNHVAKKPSDRPPCRRVILFPSCEVVKCHQNTCSSCQPGNT
jgi:hypothetical protein